MIKLDDDIPTPGSARVKSDLRIALETMEVGQSFLCQCEGSTIYARLMETRNRLPGRKFTTRAVEGGRRVWRIA